MIWRSQLNSLSKHDVVNGIRRMVEKNISWPPNLPRFLELVNDIDTDKAYDRMLNKEPSINLVERMARKEFIGEFAQRASDDLGRVKFKKVYIATQKRFNDGELEHRDEYKPSEFGQVKVTDTMIENRMKFTEKKTDIELRIDRLRGIHA